MSVKKDEAGNRSVQAEVEVPGTPEAVWKAIATGEGISSWFVPSTVDGRVGGTTTSNFGPGMESVGTVTEWQPPERFVVATPEHPPSEPAVATEWIVEAKAGGLCTVRVVHRWFATTDDWDAQFIGHTYGWANFFRILRLYLAHFAGQPSRMVQVSGSAPGTKDQAWAAWMAGLGLQAKAVGERVTASNGTPPLAGVVERMGEAVYPEELLLRLNQPTTGLAHLFAMSMGGPVFLSMRLFLYGAEADAKATRDDPIWQGWMAERFPHG